MNDIKGMKLWDVKWACNTAGPSPYNNQRTEVFLLGCNKAMNGSPCPGCFNSKTWDASIAQHGHDPIEMAAHIAKHAPNKYITIGGGEPTDQIDNLIILCKELKKYDFHIMVYTWHSLKSVFCRPMFEMGSPDPRSFVFNKKLKQLFLYIDMIIDGQYKQEKVLYDQNKEDGLLNSVGSGNQIIWDVREFNKALWPASMSIKHFIRGYSLDQVDALYVKPDNMDLVYILKDINREPLIVQI